MELDGLPHFVGWNVEIVASDISDDVIGRAKEGIYNQFEVQRVVDAIANSPQANSQQVLDQIRSSVKCWQQDGDVLDDQTIVIARITR